MKGGLALKLLEGISESTKLLSDLFVLYSVPYGTSLRGMDYYLQRHRRMRARADTEAGKRRQFSNLLYYLQKQGLIEIKKKEKKCLITEQGKERLRMLRLRAGAGLPSPHYQGEDDGTLKIIAFDIPESMKRKRAWIRAVLRNLDFHMLQRSLWAGTTKLPVSFLKDLHRLQLISCVKIFSVAKSGNIEPIHLK